MLDDKSADLSEQAELDHLSDLESKFQRIIAEIMGDELLDKFRVEYEKIYETFLESHKNNRILLSKCNDLNSEIVSNSEKVNAVLRLSRDDQRTIAGLKCEFEKAWNMVELSQERESKTREVIDQLKAELTRLSKIIEDTNIISLTEEKPQSSVPSDIENLKKELNTQNCTIKSLTSDIERLSKSKSSLDSKISKLNTVIDALTSEIDGVVCNINTVQGALKDVFDNKNSCKEMVDSCKKTIQENSIALDARNKDLDEVNRTLLNAKISLGEEEDSLALKVSSIKSNKRILNESIECREKAEKKISELNQRIAEKEKIYEELLLQRKNLDVEVSSSKAQVDGLKECRAQIENESNEKKKLTSELRKKIYLVSHDILRAGGYIKKSERDLSRNESERQRLNEDISIEKVNLKSIENIINTLMNELTNHRADLHGSRILVDVIKHDIERHKDSLSILNGNIRQVEIFNQTWLKSEQELRQDLANIQVEISKQISLNEALKSQIGFIKKQCTDVAEENNSSKNAIKSVKEGITRSKNLIREKDEQCIKVHVLSEKVKKETCEVEEDLRKSKDDYRSLLNEIYEIEGVIMRKRHLSDMAEKDIFLLNKATDGILHQSRAISQNIAKKSLERETTNEKCRILKSLVAKGNKDYDLMTRKVEELKLQLINEVEKGKKLTQDNKHRRFLETELRRLEKNVVATQGKVKALEEELETPINVHRWRFLECLNPETFYLIKITQDLKYELNGKLSLIDRLRARLKELKMSSEKQIQSLCGYSLEDTQREIKRILNILQTKSHQIGILESKLISNKPNVSDIKCELEDVKDQLRETVSDMHREKKRLSDLRGSSLSLKIPATTNENRFVGGGFALGGPASRTSSDMNRSQGHKIVVPRMSQSRKSKTPKVLPGGWNPNRPPLRPFLPTTSELL